MGGVWDEGWWTESQTRPTRKDLGPMSDDLRVFRAIEGSTESIPLVFGVETVLWPTAAKKGGEWYRGVVEAANCFMTRWQRDKAESGWLRHAAEDAKSDDKENGGGETGDAAVDASRNELVNRVARYRFD